MKRTSTLHFRVSLLILLTSGLAFLYGCEKNNPEIATSVNSTAAMQVNNTAAMQMAFNTGGFEKSLTQPFTDTVRIIWEPNWKASYNKTGRKGIKYTFVPLTPKFQSTSTGTLLAEVTLTGALRFILVKHVDSKLYFSIATYIAEQPTRAQRLPIELEQPLKLSSFSGVLTLHGLSIDENARLVYKNGLLVPAPQRGKVSKSSSANRYECEIFYDCTWYAYCGSDDRYNARMSFTSDVYGCVEPGYEPCSDWGRSWSLYDSKTRLSCWGVDDPPSDDPNDPSDSNGGTPPDPNSSCGKMNTLGAQQFVQDASANLLALAGRNGEFGYVYRNNGLNGNDYEFRQSTNTSADERLTIHLGQLAWPLDGIMHTHPPGSYTIFSMGDLQAMIRLIDRHEMNNPSTFTSFLITSNGDEYALKISNLNDFVAFGRPIATRDGLERFEDQWLSSQLGKYNISEINSRANNEQAFLRLLKEGRTGLTMFKHDRTSNTWQQRGVDANNTPINVPCQ